ncbi:hypothetical protein QQG74_19210 [Micromonospora sp. FIMYZ51]|uniref:hypothetical protein n=1 Tax=Micromonospora sp. FIMYZ51 TaxID=3051832 RepID=UPI00311FEDD7
MRVARVLAPAAIALVLLAGCGDDGGDAGSSTPSSTAPASNGIADQTAEEILAAATGALEKAGSYRVSGEAKDGGEITSIDFKVTGDDLFGTIGMEGTSIQLLMVGNKSYFKADAEFWTMMGGPEGKTMAKLINDRWVKVAPDDDMFSGISELAGMADPKSLLKPDGKITKGEVKEIEAGPAIALVDESDKSSLYVATTGEPYPLLVESSDGDVAISGFGESFPELKEPTEKEIVDLSEMTAGS